MLGCLILVFAAGVGQVVPEPMYAAIFAALMGVLLAVLIGLFTAWLWASTYREERGAIRQRLASGLDYIIRGAKWGLAGAGLGALLATALPPRLLAAAGSDPNKMPIAAWVAIAFGSVGVAIGLLEEWHGRETQGIK